MRKNLFTLVLVATLLTACSSGGEESEIEVHEVRVNAAAQGENSELLLAMHNHGGNTDQLTGVTSDIAESAELHNGEEIVQDIPVYANTELEFTPDGYHVVLTGLKQELHDGDEIEVILQFRDREDIAVHAHVGEAIEEHEHSP